MVICLTLFYLNSIASLLLPYTGTQLDLLLDPASLAARRDSQMCARMVSSARRRSSLRALLLFEGDPLHDDECEVWQHLDSLAKAGWQRGCSPYRSSHGGNCRGGLRARLRNGACLCGEVLQATRRWYLPCDRVHRTVIMMWAGPRNRVRHA